MHASTIVKRGLDIVGALALLAVTWPVLAAAALAVRWTMGAPVLYRPRRHGLDARPFTQLKLRTMREPRPDEVAAATDAERLTRLGRWLRATSIDELPQLVNVLRGDMALVGPRPLPTPYLERYTPTQRRRLAVRPGLTGLVQTSGRNGLSWDEKLALDVWYVDHRSLALDLWLLLRTPWVVLRGGGVSAPGRATAPEFLGTASDVAEVR